MHRILEVNARAVSAYLNAQIEAGAQAAMIFDTWGGALADGVFQQFSLRYIEAVARGVKREHDGTRIPLITFTKGGGQWLEAIAATGVDAVGLDWTVDLGHARERVGSRVALQGNLDPTVLFAPPAAIRREARALVERFGNHPGHVFNLGHGISQFTPPDHVAALVDEVHRASRAVRAGQPPAAPA
jgi:uroporphyrinogen decarboxylase